MGALPSSARVLVIGGGIGGLSAAYHLAMLGVRDVCLLERAELSSGTTWHSTGNMETYRADPLIFEMVRYAAELYPRIAADSGQEIGWRRVGRVMYTDREARWQLMRTLPELGRARGIEIEVLTPAEVAARLPIISADGLLGGIWVPSDARVNPTDAVTAFARLARAQGVVIREHAEVLGLVRNGGAVCGVRTRDGEIACDAVVLAAGLWSGDLAASAGLALPLYALEHQYLMTKPFGVDRDLPLFLSYDDQLYGREEVGGILFGSLDDHAIPVATRELPQNFASCLLNDRWPQFEPYMATAMRRFPVLRGAELKMLLNGPESFTPDGQMLLGPVPGASGLYAACAFNSNGMALAPAAGRYIAEWIVEGAPSADVCALDVRRFSAAQSAPAYLRERATEIPGFHCRMHALDADYQTARDIRRSPVHAELASAGARFVSANAWERPAWFLRESAGATCIEGVAEEAAAVAMRAALVDRCSDVKILLRGPGARAWLAGAAPALSACGESEAAYVPLPGARDAVEALVRVLIRSEDRCLLTAGPDQETRVAEWLRRARLPDSLQAVDQTAALACFELHGPERAAVLAALTGSALGGWAGAEGRWAGAVGIERCEDPISGSTLLLVPSDRAAYLWRRLLALGGEARLAIAGHFAEEAQRIRRGIPAFGREITPAVSIDELLGGAPRGPRSRFLAAFSSPMTAVGFGAQEVVFEDGRAVGELSSRVRLPQWPETLALGLIDPARRRAGTLCVVSEGRVWPLTPRATAWQSVLRRPSG